MPILHVYIPEGLLAHEQIKRLFEGLTQAVLKGEAAPNTPNARAVTWTFLHEMKPGTWAVGGIPITSFRVLIEIDLPQGALNERRRQRIAKGVGTVLNDLMGRELAPTEALIDEVPDGDWSAGEKSSICAHRRLRPPTLNL